MAIIQNAKSLRITFGLFDQFLLPRPISLFQDLTPFPPTSLLNNRLRQQKGTHKRKKNVPKIKTQKSIPSWEWMPSMSPLSALSSIDKKPDCPNQKKEQS